METTIILKPFRLTRLACGVMLAGGLNASPAMADNQQDVAGTEKATATRPYFNPRF